MGRKPRFRRRLPQGRRVHPEPGALRPHSSQATQPGASRPVAGRDRADPPVSARPSLPGGRADVRLGPSPDGVRGAQGSGHRFRPRRDPRSGRQGTEGPPHALFSPSRGPLSTHIEALRQQHAHELKAGVGGAFVPEVISRTSPGASMDWDGSGSSPPCISIRRRTGPGGGITSTKPRSSAPSRRRSSAPASQTSHAEWSDRHSFEQFHQSEFGQAATMLLANLSPKSYWLRYHSALEAP